MTDNDPFLKELQQRADRAHRSADRADDAPPELWQRVRAHAKTDEEESPAMSTITMPASPAPLSQPSAPGKSRGIGHYANLAVTIAIVIGVALAGWFATMQINQPPPSNPRFAALGIQQDDAGNGVCDVEPLTVDEAIVIVKDPLGSLIPDIEDPVAEGYPPYWFDRQTITVPNVYWYMGQVYDLETYGVPFPEADFDDAQLIVDEYLDCLKDGTHGQIWQLTDPVTVQAHIALMLPVLSSEEDAREQLPEILDSPTMFSTGGTDESQQLKRNPEQEHTGYIAASGFLGFPGYAVSPVVYLDAEGDVLIEADLFGNSIDDPTQEADGSMNVIYGRSAVDNQWYVIDFFFPFAIPGFD